MNRKDQKSGIYCLIAVAIALIMILPATVDAEILVIDPGHGGTQSGAESAIDGFYEKTINLFTALSMRDSLCLFYEEEYDFFLTRDWDTTLTLIERVMIVEQVYATAFLSIHHNAGPPSSNYTRVWWCSSDTTNDGYFRNNDSLLAKKAALRLRDELPLEYSICSYEHFPCDSCNLTVLGRNKVVSALTEASFVTNPEEAERFYYGDRMEQEGGILASVWDSYVTGMGIATVKTAYSDGDDGEVWINSVQHESPFEGNWHFFEQYYIQVPQQQYFADAYQRTFFRWIHALSWRQRDSSHWSYSYDPNWYVTVPSEPDEHVYIAFYSGGPYEASISRPADTVYVGELDTLPWSSPAGAFSTTVAAIDLDTNGGTGGYPIQICSPAYHDSQWIYWDIGNYPSPNAKLRIVASDAASNRDTAYSAPFVIYDCGTLEVDWEELSTNKPQIDTLFFDYLCNKDHELTLTVYRHNGAVWDSVDTPFEDSSFSAGEHAVVWEIDQAYQGEYATYKVEGFCTQECGGPGEFLADSFSVEYQIINNKPTVIQPMFFVGGRVCHKVGGESAQACVVAFDEEDGSNLYYRWEISKGHLPGGGQLVITDSPVITYLPPAEEPGCGKSTEVGPQRLDTISVRIIDQHYGYTVNKKIFFLECGDDTCVTPPGCSCPNQGDVANGDGTVNVLDVVYMIDYVFRAGPPPLWSQYCPMSKGQFNCDDVIDVLDVVYVIDYAFRFGPSPCDGCAKRDLT